MRCFRFSLPILATVLALAVAAFAADTFKNKQTGETLKGKLIATAEQDGKKVLYVQIEGKGNRFLDAATWQSVTEAEALIEALRTDDEDQRDATVESLIALGNNILPALERAAQDKDPRVRVGVETAIAAIEADVERQREKTAKEQAPTKPEQPKPTPEQPRRVVERSKPVEPKADAKPVEYEPCPRCLGQSRFPCKSCSGTGAMSSSRRKPDPRNPGAVQPQPATGTFGAQMPCMQCMGRGFFRCPMCRGRGQIPRRY